MQEFFICYPPLNSSTLYFSDLYICFWYFFHCTKSFLRAGILSFPLQYALGRRESSIYEGLKGHLLEENVNINIDGLWVEDGWMDGRHEPLGSTAMQISHTLNSVAWNSAFPSRTIGEDWTLILTLGIVIAFITRIINLSNKLPVSYLRICKA